MKTLTRFLAAGTIVVGALMISESASEISETDCETYQGYNDITYDGETMFVFDEQNLESRGRKRPNYSLFGDPNMKKSLTIGGSYKLTIKSPLIGSDQLDSVNLCK
mgnify:CR=1 FL=1|jgi:hypothetical protein